LQRLVFLVVLLISNLIASTKQLKQQEIEPGVFRIVEDAIIYSKKGKIADVFFKGKVFTSYQKKGDMIRISGTFPKKGKWKGVKKELWVKKEKIKKLIRPKFIYRPKGIKRYIVINKSKFELKVIEEKKGKKRVIFKTKVATGIDSCLPKEEGGRCYYTETGTYKVRWKVFDPKGIKWCIPKFMEKEKKYQEDIKRGKRCFRGSIGKYALNIGKSYAIHGTSNPASIGTKASHGCIRTRNSDIEKIFGLMKEGDKVIIRN